MLADVFPPEEAVAAGMLDQVVDPADLRHTAQAVAVKLAGLDLEAHRRTKLRARARVLHDLRAAMDEDDAELAGLLPASGS
jgi:enoyl-CoA hydratase/carnithine racemase